MLSCGQMSSPIKAAPYRKWDQSPQLYEKGWYHSIALPGGSVIEGLLSLETLRARLARMPVPADLRGKRVLDIGAWDGWFSFEMEKRGAEVVAVDCVELDTFHEAHRLLNSKVRYLEMDLLELTPATVGRFDIVLFLGVLYHLKHPMLGLERVCALATDLAIVESFAADIGEYPLLEFYETDELRSQLDNWFGPNLGALAAMCRSVGFARVETLYTDADRAALACYRHWPAMAHQIPLVLNGAQNNRTHGMNFYSSRDEYVTCWFESPEPALTRLDVFPEVHGYGSMPIDVRRFDQVQWMASFALPPGLDPGWHGVRLRTRERGWSETRRIAVDIPASTDRLELRSIYDGISWDPGVVHGANGGFASMWMRGLPDNADRANIRVYAGGKRHPVIFVSALNPEGERQVNVKLRDEIGEGEHQIHVAFGATLSNALAVRITPSQ